MRMHLILFKDGVMGSGGGGCEKGLYFKIKSNSNYHIKMME